MTYVEINKEFIDFRKFEIDKLYVELDDNGKVRREIGVNQKGKIVHVFPSKDHDYGEYGLLDLSIFDLDSINEEMRKVDFEELWYAYKSGLDQF